MLDTYDFLLFREEGILSYIFDIGAFLVYWEEDDELPYLLETVDFLLLYKIFEGPAIDDTLFPVCEKNLLLLEGYLLEK